MDAQPKRNGSGAAAATITRPIATTGEDFADGPTIDLVGSDQNGNPRLLLWDGASGRDPCNPGRVTTTDSSDSHRMD